MNDLLLHTENFRHWVHGVSDVHALLLLATLATDLERRGFPGAESIYAASIELLSLPRVRVGYHVATYLDETRKVAHGSPATAEPPPRPGGMPGE